MKYSYIRGIIWQEECQRIKSSRKLVLEVSQFQKAHKKTKLLTLRTVLRLLYSDWKAT